MIGSKFTLGGAAPLTRPLAEKISHSKRVFDTTYVIVKFWTSSCDSFGDIKDDPNFYKKVLRPLHAP